MLKKQLVTTLALALCLALSSLAVAQDLHPSRRPSPAGIARTFVGDTYVSIFYSRPYKRGRDNIFGTEESGALVPYDRIWRTGANEATQLTATGDIVFGEEGKLRAGTYSVFSTPGPETWTIHFNSALGLNGTDRRNPESGEFENGYLPENDVLVLEVTPATLDEEVDQFTISFETDDDGTDMVWRWITTEIRVPMSSD